MNKKYCIITIISFLLIIFFSLIIVFINNENYAIMSSILIPILFGFLINYDNKQKDKYKLFYQPLFYHIRLYYEILEKNDDRLKFKKKNEMLCNISRNIISFLHQNMKYASNEICEMLSIFLFYEYENKNNQNELQDLYNINRIAPLITKEVLENYNSLHIISYINRKKYLKKSYKESNGVVYLYVDSYLMDIARKKGIAIGVTECITFFKKIEEYRNRNYTKYYKLYKYIKKNKNVNIDLFINDLNTKFDFKI